MEFRMSSFQKDMQKFLKAVLAADGRGTFGTAPSWNLLTGEYEICRVSAQVGEDIFLFDPPAARRMGEIIAGTTLATDLIEMAEIAERMNEQRPTMEQANAEYYGPSDAVH